MKWFFDLLWKKLFVLLTIENVKVKIIKSWCFIANTFGFNLLNKTPKTSALKLRPIMLPLWLIDQCPFLMNAGEQPSLFP